MRIGKAAQYAAVGLAISIVCVGADDRPRDDRSDSRQPPRPPGASQRVIERNRMVHTQIAEPRDGRQPVRDPLVLEAMRTVPRHVFVPPGRARQAYDDGPLPIGHGQTISQPYIVALMTELLELNEESKVLEIGTGSGYQAAVLAHMTPHVYTIEIVEPLGRRAESVLTAQKYDQIKRKIGDGYQGWPQHAPFDAVIVTCAADALPEPLWDQLRPGGRIVIPIGEAGAVQELRVVHKTDSGQRRDRTVIPVRFVPLTRENDQSGDRERP